MGTKPPAIGIDLGTTFSCVAVWQNGKVDIIANDDGDRTTPSYVAFTDGERLIGKAAKNQATINPTNTIFDAKRFIGNRLSDKNIQEHRKHWPFKLIEVGGNPTVQISTRGGTKNFAVEEISAMVLTKMKETAEAYLGSEVKDAVITVPAYFNDSQRQATKDAGTIAGLNVLRIINEPTAAALAYGLDKNLRGNKNVLVFDLGGGTFDVSIVTIGEGSLFEVKATSGDTNLGGEDFDNRLVDHCISEFYRKFNKDMTGNQRAVRRLRTMCEEAKRTLSSSMRARIAADMLHASMDLEMVITRDKFEELCIDLFKKTMHPVEKALKDAKMDKTQIDEVVLVGGSTRIPKIRNLLGDFFNGKELSKSINPDEAVAHGAAILAATLSGNSTDVVPIVSLVDITPFSLGVDIVGGRMSTVMMRNTVIPSKRSRIYVTLEDNQTSIKFCVHEGERAMVKDNRLLGSFELTDMPEAPAGVSEAEVTFDIDASGILTVSARDLKTGKQTGITIKKENGRLVKHDITRMTADLQNYKAEAMKQLENAAARNQLEDYISGIKRAVDAESTRDKSAFWKSYKIVAEKNYMDVLKWLDNNRLASKDASEKKLKEFQKDLRPVILKLSIAGSLETGPMHADDTDEELEKPAAKDKKVKKGPANMDEEPSKKRNRRK